MLESVEGREGGPIRLFVYDDGAMPHFSVVGDQDVFTILDNGTICRGSRCAPTPWTVEHIKPWPAGEPTPDDVKARMVPIFAEPEEGRAYTVSATIKGVLYHFFMLRSIDEPEKRGPLFNAAEVERVWSYFGPRAELTVKEVEVGHRVIPRAEANAIFTKFLAEGGYNFPEGEQGYDMPFVAWHLPGNDTSA